jgi:AbrB family looped-hinge helix DNA binding protein
MMSDKSYTLTVGKRGEIVIPAEVRKLFNLKYGSNLVVQIRDKKITAIPQNYSSFKEKWLSKRKKLTQPNNIPIHNNSDNFDN